MVKKWETLFLQVEHSFTMAMAFYGKETLMSSPTIRSLKNVGLNGDLYETATLVLPRLEREYPSDPLLQGNLRFPPLPLAHHITTPDRDDTDESSGGGGSLTSLTSLRG